jgi:hypothetical protein
MGNGRLKAAAAQDWPPHQDGPPSQASRSIGYCTETRAGPGELPRGEESAKCCDAFRC